MVEENIQTIYVMYVDNKITGWHDNLDVITDHFHLTALQSQTETPGSEVVYSTSGHYPLGRYLILYTPGFRVLHDLRIELLPKKIGTFCISRGTTTLTND